MDNSEEKRNYNFKILREEAVTRDELEENPHENVAKSIFKLINSEEKAITIGLEGTWGSGKSSVISMLREKIKSEKILIPVFQFDAWAHEGDPLRRIFLESFIVFISNSIKNGFLKTKYPEICVEELQLKKERINNREKITNTVSTVSTTWLVRILTISLFFVPIGSAIMSKVDFNKLGLEGKPDCLFFISAVLLSSPLIVILGNSIRCICRRLKHKIKFNDPLNWSFTQGDSKKTDRSQTSEDSERSSIEFEKYFIELLECAFKTEIKSLVIVIDNLDRIDPHDSLKIWSTLQTFLQQRNNPTTEDTNFNKVWFIIPYDRDGLSALWEKSNGKDKLKPIPKSFFDKCFQLRIEIPKTVFTIGEKYLNDKIEESMGEWLLDDKKAIKSILTNTRSDLADIPTPRSIKNYINQIGYLANNWGGIIPITSIAYYVFLRELLTESVESIKSKLLDGSLKTEMQKMKLDESVLMDIAGLLFGVNPKRGAEILLIPKIDEAAKNGDPKMLNDLYDIHGNNLWTVIDFYFKDKVIDLEFALSFSHCLYNSVWENNKNVLVRYLDILTGISFKSKHEDQWLDEKIIPHYISLILISEGREKFIDSLYSYIIKILDTALKSAESKKYTFPKGLIEIIDSIKKIGIEPEKITIENLSLNRLFEWKNNANYSILSNYIKPSISIVTEIAGSIKNGSPIHESLFDAIEYSINSGVTDKWDAVALNCKTYIEATAGAFTDQSESIYKILAVLEYKAKDKVHPIIEQVIRGGHFYSILHSLNQKVIVEASLLCGYILKTELHSTTIPAISNSTPGFDLIKLFWKTPNEDNALKIITEIRKYGLWDIIWIMATDKNNKLAGNIINIALIEVGTSDLFKASNGLQKLLNYSNIIDKENDKRSELTNKLLIYSPIEKEIIESKRIDIFAYRNVIQEIINKTQNSDVLHVIKESICEINEEVWEKGLTKNISLVKTALLLKEKIQYYLPNNFLNALKCVMRGISTKQDKQSKFLEYFQDDYIKVVSLMPASFITADFSKEMSKLLLDTKFIVPEIFYTINKSYFNYSKIAQEKDTINDSIKEIIEANKDYDRLSIIVDILENDEEKKYIPDSDFAELIKIPFNSLYFKYDEGSKEKEILKKVSDKLIIKIDKKITEEKSNEDTMKSEEKK